MSLELELEAEVRPAPSDSRLSGRGPGTPLIAAVVGAVVIAFSSILVDLSGADPATAAIFRCLYRDQGPLSARSNRDARSRALRIVTARLGH